jgi:site-specific DNA-methyltransferase (adenine-specific)
MLDPFLQWALQTRGWALLPGDCLERMKDLPDNSIDAVVTDPPAGISFMNKDWDDDKGGRQQWVSWMARVMKEALRVLKPGGHALVWAIPRTSHWTAWAIEDAGFEVRDIINHAFGSGFPKSVAMGKQIDKMLGAPREVVGKRIHPTLKNPTEKKSRAYHVESLNSNETTESWDITAPASEEAKSWEGWGTNLKPAVEHWILARKPLIGTIAKNVLTHGTGAINIDACRVETADNLNGGAYAKNGSERTDEWGLSNGFRRNQGLEFKQPTGRWPANLILSHHPSCIETDEEVESPGYQINRFTDGAKPFGGGAGHEYTSEKISGGKRKIWLCHPNCPLRSCFPSAPGQQGRLTGGEPSQQTKNCYGQMEGRVPCEPRQESDTSAARFFYAAKANKGDRAGSSHPTVKAQSLMRYLCRLITPPGGLILDPFAGSGSTGQAALAEGFRCIMIEREAEYLTDIQRRMASRKGS